jgi:hypothetical protein
MSRMRGSNLVTVFAVGFLALDSVLLFLAGFWTGQFSLLVWGAVFAAAAAGVVSLWRRHKLQMQELNQEIAAREMEFIAMQRELEQKRDN